MSFQAPLLQVRNLTVSLGRREILRQIDLDVMPHHIHAVVGPNGAGKTTLMRSLLGGVPHRGEIRFRFRRGGRIGYVPQQIDFDRRLPLTVSDFLAIALFRRPVFAGVARGARRRIDELLARTGCDQLRDRVMGDLSGGELRRVLLAQSLSPTPEVLLLDEPISNVDVQGARLFEQLLRRLRDEDGITLVMVAHDISAIARIADRATGLNRAVTYAGPAAELDDPGVLARVFGTSGAAQADAPRSRTAAMATAHG